MQTNLIEVLTNETLNGNITWINDNPITKTIYRSIQKQLEDVFCDEWYYTTNGVTARLTEYNKKNQ